MKYSGIMTYFIQNFRTLRIFLCILGHFRTILSKCQILGHFRILGRSGWSEIK